MEELTLKEILELFLLTNNFIQKQNIIEKYPKIMPYIEHQNTLYSLNEDGVKYLINNGFKLDRMIYLKKNELKYFLTNGATYIIDLPEENTYRFTLEQLDIAVKNGYKFTENSHVSNFPEETLKHFCDQENYEVIISYLNTIDDYELIIRYYREKGYNSIFEFTDSIGMSEKVCNQILFKNAFKILNTTDIKYLKERYYNEPKIIQYIDFIIDKNHQDIIGILKNKDEIYNFFQESGPKKELYNSSLFNNVRLFYILFKNDDNWKNIYDENKDSTTISYINFILENLKKESYNTLSSIVKDSTHISDFFTKEGPKKSLYNKALFNNRTLYNLLFKDDSWEKIYNQPNDITIISYINFLNERGYSSINSIVKEYEDISKYFDEFGPTKAIYDKALTSNTELFNIFFQDDTYKKIYNEEKDKNTIFYINFIKKYGLILTNIIKDKKDIDKYFDEYGYTEELKKYFRDNKEETNSLLISLAINDKVVDNLNDDFVNMFEYYLIDRYFSTCTNKKEKYEYLLKHIGPQILFNFENDNIKKMINININELNNFFNLFDLNTKIISKQNASNNIIASLLNYKFRKNHRDIIMVFPELKAIIEKMTVNELKEYLDDGIINDKTAKLNYWFKIIINELEYDTDQIEKFKNIIKNYKNNYDSDSLHEVCEEYLTECERKHAKLNHKNILLDFGIKPLYDSEDKAKAYSDYLLNNLLYDDFISIRDKYFDKLDGKSIKGYDKLKTLSKEQYNLIIMAIKEKKEPDISIKQEFSILKKFISKFSKFYVENNLISKEEFSKMSFKGISPAVGLENIDVLKIIRELDLEIFLKYTNENPEVLENLRMIINNYGLGRLPESMGDTFEQEYKVELPNGINNIGSFITKYHQLLKNKQRNLKNQGKIVALGKIHLSFSEVIELISLANSETYELRRLLGKNEYYDFATNKRPNTSEFDRQKRESKLERIVDYLYALSEVTIPSHDMLLESEKHHKKINFIVGNRTNASNICHGERTGSCMRIGSIGEGLFLKCLTDKNWFHIRIEDPITHEYVSRISGFRNGNTVYLNQLRVVSSGCSYTNEDLQEYIKMYAENLIEETKNSNYPVENVFINTKLAMKYYEGKTYILDNKIQKDYNIDDVKDLKLCNRSDIWTDVRNEAFLLATTEEGKKTKEGYVPLKNVPDNTEIYQAARDKIYGLEYDKLTPKHHFINTSKEELIEKINRVHAMREKLLGSDYRYDISDVIVEEEQLIDGYASADWFVYLDSNNNIHIEYIETIKKNNKEIPYRQKEQAQEELEYYKEILINKYNLKQKNSYAI